MGFAWMATIRSFRLTKWSVLDYFRPKHTFGMCTRETGRPNIELIADLCSIIVGDKAHFIVI